MTAPKAKVTVVVIILAVKLFMDAFSLAGRQTASLNLRLSKSRFNDISMTIR
jgi:hypothetical protein